MIFGEGEMVGVKDARGLICYGQVVRRNGTSYTIRVGGSTSTFLANEEDISPIIEGRRVGLKEKLLQGKLPKVKNLGGEELSGLNALFGARVNNRAKNKYDIQRRTRNCGDTAAFLKENLPGRYGKTPSVRLEDCIKKLSMPATSHEVWQITIHLHTFSLERSGAGENRLVQSYQASDATYNVQWWCSLPDSYADTAAVVACSAMREAWFSPSDRQIAELSILIEALYKAKPKDRVAVWRKMPFHPGDGARILGGWESVSRTVMKDEDEVAGSELTFAAETLDLGNAGFPALMIALDKFLN